MTQVVDNDYIRSLVDRLRDTGTKPADFYRITETIAQLLTYEALKTEEFSSRKIPVWTEDDYEGLKLEEHKIVIMPILRAGIGMLDGARQLLPEAQVQVLGMYRNEETLQPVWYYNKLPADMSGLHAILIDPMLATGGSLSGAVEELRQRGCQHITVLAIVAAPEGISRLESSYDRIRIFVAAKDKCLNEDGYILPGLGDAGDRIFNT